MSIQKVWIDKLHVEFLTSSEKYTEISSTRKKLCNEIKSIIEEFSIKDIPKEELSVLEKLPDFWKTFIINPGTDFRNSYGGIKKDPWIEKLYGYHYGIDIKVSKSFYETYDCSSYRDMSCLPPEISSKLIEINNEILNLDYIQTSLELSWKRLINRETKKTWLKINFPKIYERLRYYETNISV